MARLQQDAIGANLDIEFGDFAGAKRLARRVRVMRVVSRVLKGHGAMVQFTYGVHCPVPSRTLARLGARALRTARIWRNVPPASIWRIEPRCT